MQPPIWLPENLFDRGQYPGHTLTVVGGEAIGFEIRRLADGQRDETRYKGTTANTEIELRLDCGTPRVASALFLDRGHNLGSATQTARRWLLELSGDAWATADEDVLDINTHPTAPGGALDTGFGAIALDGSWGRIFPARVSRYWRMRIPAVASYIPEVTGLYLGRHFQQQRPVAMPYATFEADRFYEEQESIAGRIGRSRTYRRRQGRVLVRSGSPQEYHDNFKPWLEDAYRDASQPAWLVLDPDLPTDTMLNVLCPRSSWAFAVNRSSYPYPVAEVPFLENTPEVI